MVTTTVMVTAVRGHGSCRSVVNTVLLLLLARVGLVMVVVGSTFRSEINPVLYELITFIIYTLIQAKMD